MVKKVRVKPGRAASISGFIAGIVFCCIGVFLVIPSFGLFGLFWTAIAAVGTITSAINLFSSKGIASHVITVEEAPQDAPGKSIEERLSLLRTLYDKGSISAEEYEEKRRAILNEI